MTDDVLVNLFPETLHHFFKYLKKKWIHDIEPRTHPSTHWLHATWSQAKTDLGGFHTHDFFSLNFIDLNSLGSTFEATRRDVIAKTANTTFWIAIKVALNSQKVGSGQAAKLNKVRLVEAAQIGVGGGEVECVTGGGELCRKCLEGGEVRWLLMAPPDWGLISGGSPPAPLTIRSMVSEPRGSTDFKSLRPPQSVHCLL